MGVAPDNRLASEIAKSKLASAKIGSRNEAQEAPCGGVGPTAATPNPNLSPRPCL